jgi:hypothetical protein
METKVWDMSLTKEDLEVLMGVALSDGEWNIIVDELYNNDKLYNTVTTLAVEIAKIAIE